jgi:hypothetical protein
VVLPFPAFEARAFDVWATIPERFRAGCVLLVHADTRPDPADPEVFVLGMCEAAFAGTVDMPIGESQSIVHVWYGSFVSIAARARAFDAEGELEETILHELTHHWEGRAGLMGLDLFDAAQIANFHRRRDIAVAPGFWRHGERHAGLDGWVIDGDVFVEVAGPPPWTVHPPDGGPPVTAHPDPLDGWATILERGLPFDGAPGDLVIAPRPRPSMWQRLRSLLTRSSA